ncbi:MAG TPA: PIG-L family deacetylase [Candidatus Acidoferrales bacterium]
MTRWRTILPVAILAVVAALSASPRVTGQSLADTIEAINKSRVTTRILFVTAHPDDEWSSLLTYLSRGLNADVGLLTLTRGQGGQNAIGPEQGGALGVIRTEELLAAGEHYGVHQFFTRAPDFGFSKSADQTMKIWDNIALEDMVRAIRTYRPQVVINGWGGVHSGHGQHQASGILTPQAVAAAADPKMFPEQIAEGLPPWKVTLEVRLAREKTPDAVELPVSDVSPLWGKSYTEMGAEGHALHRSQGTPAFFGNVFFRRPIYLVAENEKGTAGKFDAKLLAEPLTSLSARFPSLQASMATRLTAADADLKAALAAARTMQRTDAATSLAQAGLQVGASRNEISRNAMADRANKETSSALWELQRASERIDRALAEVVALPFEAQADRHELVAGEDLSVEVTVGKPIVPVKWTLDVNSLEVPTGWTATKEETKHDSESENFKITIPPDAKPPSSPEDAILPFPRPLIRVALAAVWSSYRFTIEKPVQSVQATTTGIATYPLELVPAVTLTVEPQQVMVPVQRASEPVKLLARIRYHGTKPAKVEVGVDAPDGWKAQPIAPLDFSAAGDQLIRFIVAPPAQTPPGAYALHPYARIGEETFRTSLEPIPTLPTRNWSEPSDATVHVLDLNVPANLRVGYIAAENDPLPEILRQLGIQVDLLDEVALAFGDLSQYDAITVGIRAYELRPDLMRANQRLLDYVDRGGTLLVQYQRDFAWDKELPAPYPAKMGDKVARVTDPNSPVRFLAPDSPLMNTPNKITLADFQGWEQERGLYFWGTFDQRYQALLGLKDFNDSEVTGGLVTARVGKGLYIYTGLSFFRELPAGVPGAYRLFVNLLSQTPHAAAKN